MSFEFEIPLDELLEITKEPLRKWLQEWKDEGYPDEFPCIDFDTIGIEHVSVDDADNLSITVSVTKNKELKTRNDFDGKIIFVEKNTSITNWILLNERQVSDYTIRLILNLSDDSYMLFIRNDELEIDTFLPDSKEYQTAARMFTVISKIIDAECKRNDER